MSIQNKLIVKASDESESEDLIDPQEVLRGECTEKKCSGYENRLKECNDRVNSRTKTAETCMEEVIDFMHCVDHCVAKSLFSKLK
jgi:ubiquinol-cytochrome c reductase subunit 6